MINSLFDYLAPHYCCSCGAIGSILCNYCKYNIIDEPFLQCIVCGKQTQSENICMQCRPPFRRAWCTALYGAEMKKLIRVYKFNKVRSASSVLAETLHTSIGNMPKSVVISSVPTATSHIRERGFDHAQLLAKQLAKRTKCNYETYIARNHTKSQKGATRHVREQQARDAFRAVRPVRHNNPILLVDDIVTTGATLHFASKVLQEAGASEVWVAAAAYQPLD